jgi:hypothetical protein
LSWTSPHKIAAPSAWIERDWWSPPIKLGEPKAFDLITDPKEEYPATALRNTWNAAPAMKIVSDFEASLKRYPPIAPSRAYSLPVPDDSTELH